MTATQQKSNLQDVAIAKIRIREDKIRDVQRNEKFEDLKRSIQVNGLLMPILLTVDPKNEGGFILVAGLHRLTAMTELGMLFIPANIIEGIDEDDTNWAQFAENNMRQNQTPLQCAKFIQRMMASDKYCHLTKKELLLKMGFDKSPQWLDNQLSLTELVPEAAEALERGDISVSNAAQLGKLDSEDQFLFLERAQTDASNDFMQAVQNRLQEVKAEKQGKEKKDLDPLRAAKLRTKTEIKDKYNELQPLVLKENADPYNVAFFEGVAWCIRMDAETIEAKEREEKEREEQKKKDLEQRTELIRQQKERAEARRKAAEG